MKNAIKWRPIQTVLVWMINAIDFYQMLSLSEITIAIGFLFSIFAFVFWVLGDIHSAYFWIAFAMFQLLVSIRTRIEP